MNKLIVLCGMVFLGITSTSQTEERPQIEKSERVAIQGEMIPVALTVRLKEDRGNSIFTTFKVCTETVSESELDLSTITYLEMDEAEDLGFDTREYLPENFNPYESYVDLKAIPYLEEGEEDLVSAALKGLLPEGYNPYAAPADFMDISYMEEEDMDLGFDTKVWLPEGFDAYSNELDLDTIIYIEDDSIDLGFDTSLYLPENFNPYSL